MKIKSVLSLLLMSTLIHAPALARSGVPAAPVLNQEQQFSTRDLQVIEAGITQQVTSAPVPSETHLNSHERWMLSKILFSLTWRGLAYGGRALVGQVIPLEPELANNLHDLSEDRIHQYELNILLLFKSLVDRRVCAVNSSIRPGRPSTSWCGPSMTT